MPKSKRTSTHVAVPRRGRPGTRQASGRVSPTKSVISSATSSSGELARFLAIIQEEVRQEVSRQMTPCLKLDDPAALPVMAQPTYVPSSTSVGTPVSTSL